MFSALIVFAVCVGGATGLRALPGCFSPGPGPAPLLAVAAGIDTVSIPATFTATGGSITRSGLYTAGTTPGTFRVIATAGGLADTAVVSLTRSSPSGGGAGIPFGPFGVWEGDATLKSNVEAFTLSVGTVTPETIRPRLAVARGRGMKLILAMTGGAHARYMTGGIFDMAKWKAAMDRYDTGDIKAAVAEGVADGTIVGNSVMDEPQNTSADNSWGPPGTMSKPRVDEMCGYAKSIFPTLPVGVVHDHRMLDPGKNYTVCEFVLSQYREAKGPVTAFRDGGVAFAARSGVAIAFSLNILDGGTRMSGCPAPATGGPGTYGSNCRMTPAQILEFGRVLGPAGCAFSLWRYDSRFMALPENQQAFEELAGHLTMLPERPCRRS